MRSGKGVLTQALGIFKCKGVVRAHFLLQVVRVCPKVGQLFAKDEIFCGAAVSKLLLWPAVVLPSCWHLLPA